MILLIFNPVSGRINDKKLMLGRIIERLSRKGRIVTVYQTTGDKDVKEIILSIKDVASYETIVVCGGDGTLHEVINGMILAGIDVPIGYIPAGSTNDFAKNFGITTKNALKIILDRKVKRYDLGCLNGKYFSYVAAFGNFTDVTFSTKQSIKNSIGYIAYIIEALGRLSDIKPFHAKIIADGCEIEDDFAVGLFTNAYYTAGFRNYFIKDIDLNDGLLEYVLIRMPEKPKDLSDIMRGLFKGVQDNSMIITGSGKEFIIKSSFMTWSLDGENGGTYNDCEIMAVKDKIQVYSGN